MTTREEIEAACDWWRGCVVNCCESCDHAAMEKLFTLADAYLAERAERQRRIEAAVREILGTCNVGCICAQCEDRMRDIINKHLEQS